MKTRTNYNQGLFEPLPLSLDRCRKTHGVRKNPVQRIGCFVPARTAPTPAVGMWDSSYIRAIECASSPYAVALRSFAFVRVAR